MIGIVGSSSCCAPTLITPFALKGSEEVPETLGGAEAATSEWALFVLETETELLGVSIPTDAEGEFPPIGAHCDATALLRASGIKAV